MPQSRIEQVIEQVNRRIDESVCSQPDGSHRPYVCIICDRILKPSTLSVIQENQLRKFENTLRFDGFANLSRDQSVVSDYCYKGDNAMDWMKDLLLSPRASYVQLGRGRGFRPGYSACSECKRSASRPEYVPTYAIANKYYFGTPSDALTCLNDVELALITPMKAYGFVFTYSGGKQCNLKGVLSYFRVKEHDIAKALIQLEVLGLNEHVVVLYTGEFTKEQKEKVKKISSIRTDVVLNAIRTIVQQHRLWDSIDLNEIRKQLLDVGPTVIDESTCINGSEDRVNSNIETTETFVAYFPDGTMKSVSGGQVDVDTFKRLVERSKFNLEQVEFQCQLAKEAASDYQDDNFLRACLLQFPYGFGGMSETRMKQDGSLTSSVNLVDYVQHLSYISQPHFHRPLFVLILYSIFQRQLMLKASSLNVRGDVNYTQFSTDLNADDVDQAIKYRRVQHENRKKGYPAPTIPGGTFVSNKYLNCIDAVAKALPHSNKAADRARTEGECMCHHLGFPTIFLSLSPDDENSFLLQVFAGVTIDNDAPIESLSDDELAIRARHRRELRIRNPGLCAFNFEILLDIVLSEIVGIDMETKTVLKEGYFGLVKAAMVTVEEQGRNTLHAHMLLWVAELHELLEDAQNSNKTKVVRNKAQTAVAQKYSDMCTTNLLGSCGVKELRKVFKHNCSDPSYTLPSCVDDQQLRNLRHMDGCSATKHHFAFCKSCQRTWTHEEIVQMFLQNSVRIPRFTSYPDDCRRLTAMCVQYQKPSSTKLAAEVVNAAYNTHFSFHTKSCFTCNDKRKSKTSRKRKIQDVECRMRLPDRKRKRTNVNEIGHASWYTWDGQCVTRTMIEINPRRGEFDQFQNVSCPIISESKMTCNSNVKILSPGPIVMYVTKYIVKPNRKSETADYSRVAEATRKMLKDERKYSNDKSEAMRRILRASFAHNKSNVIGPSLAAWLTRKGTRFMVSENFAWCPLRDLDTLLKKSRLNLTLRSVKDDHFFENSALHYLCRPTKLENVPASEFYAEYEVRYVARKKRNKTNDENEVLPFENTKYFKHPSYKKKTNRMAQGVRNREKRHLLKLQQWIFPDTANFNGSILNENTPITQVIERYCRLVLILFLPFRCEEDLLLDGSHTKRLRLCVRQKLICQSAFDYLQNLQDVRCNALRYPAVEDELARKTIPFRKVDDGMLHSDSEEFDDDSDDDDHDPTSLDDLLDSIFLSTGTSDSENELPTALNFTSLKEKGSKQCGYDKIADVSTPTRRRASHFDSFIRTQRQAQSNAEEHHDDSDDRQNRFKARQTKSRKQIVETVFNFKTTRQRTFPTFNKEDKPINVREANGTAASIIDWAAKAKLDKNQRRTFEILAASFVLTFYDDAHDKDIHGTRGSRFKVEHKKLQCLSQRSAQGENLVAFVHGPGGAGKSTIVDLVILYCKEYCEHIDIPFTSHTIVVTALTGVAATILMGDTTHRSVYINSKNDFSADQVDVWKETRLLIVDEVSFAGPSLFEKLDVNLRHLTGKQWQPYGGLNVVFSGDLQQLKPVGDDSICDTYCPQFEEWMNCYMELDGKHRFKNDPEWGNLLFRFRNGVPTIDDIKEINKRVCLDASDLPPSIRYATYTNKDRDAINTAIFSKYCSTNMDSDKKVRSAMIILSDDLQVKNSTNSYVAVAQPRNFWQNCGEDDIVCKNKINGRVDPALKLFRDCPIMLTTNDDVKAGKANGTRARVKHVVLKGGENTFDINVEGCVVPAAFASQIHHVELEHENNNIQPQLFNLEPRQYSIYAYVPQLGIQSTRKQDKRKVEMKIKQLPITSNSATTGHKLQGSGVDNLFVHTWCYKDNWTYVVLSRVKTISGLYLREHLSYDLNKYTMSSILKQKIDNFRENKTRKLPTKAQYSWMMSDNDSLVGEPRDT